MDKNINILVAEDDPDINGLLCKLLQRQSLNAHAAFSGSEAFLCLKQFDFQLLMLDLMLPGMTGEELIKRVRQEKTMPIIVISAKSSKETKVEVLKLGADDFISKPFDNDEVIARVEAQLRRYMVFSPADTQSCTIEYKDLELKRESRKVFVKKKEITLTAREYSILELLMSYPDKVFTKANLYEHVWNDDFLGDDNTLNVHISNLRSKIAAVDKSAEYIKTVWGIGFKMA